MDENLFAEENEEREEKKGSRLNKIKLELKEERKRKRKHTTGVPTEFVCCSCFAILFLICLFGVRIAHLIISIKNIIDSFKLFYLLLIISFIIFCLSFVAFVTLPTNIKIIFGLLILIVYGMDAWCYYLYLNEEINHKAIFVLLICSDCGNIPLIIAAICCQIYCFHD